ncbi:MAG TPA: hypothetical protein VNG35_09075 [Gemmatimonadales bacterium]|nr:hypothetical protein [Gemmatimonadales bacterium]
MNVRIAGLFGLAALVAGAALSCKSDPTADGVGTPSQVLVNFKSFNLNVGDSATVTAQVVDIRSTPLEQTITFTPCDASVTASLDPSYDPHPALSERAIIHAVGPNATCVVAGSAGAKPDTVSLIILPTSFGGAFSASTADRGSTLTISSTATLKFDTASVTVTFSGGATPPILSKTPDQLQVLVPFSNPGPLLISGIAVTYVSGLVVTLPTSASFTQTGSDPFPGDNAWGTAPDITSLLPASGQSTLILATSPASDVPNSDICPEARFLFGPSGKCAIFKFTLAAPTTITFTTDWDGGSGDSDFLICSDTTAASYDTTFTTFHPCEADGLAGASSSKPETAGGVSYPAGTYWFVAQDFDGGGVKNYYIKASVQ